MTKNFSQAKPSRDWMAMVGLLGVALFINFADRGNLATAAPLITREFALSNTSFGFLISAFFITYVPAQLVSGWMAHRFNTSHVLAAGLIVWAAATALSGIANGFWMMFVLRLLLGLGESVAIPCSSKLISEHVPPDQLGKANGILSVGSALGPALGIFLGGMLMASQGWRITFIVFGVCSLLWLVPWFMLKIEPAKAWAQAHVAPPSYFEIMKQREAWGASLGHFSFNYTTYFLLAWLPLYLVKTYGLSMEQVAVFGGLGTLLCAASALFFGWQSDRWIAAGNSVSRVRKTMACVGFLLSALGMSLCTLGNANIAIAGLIIAASFHGLMSCNIYTIAQSLSGPNAAGKWTGFQNFIGNFAGIFAPIVSGVIVDQTGSFYWAFAIAGCASLLGILGYGILITQIATINWQERPFGQNRLSSNSTG
jgi:MFS family permease